MNQLLLPIKTLHVPARHVKVAAGGERRRVLGAARLVYRERRILLIRWLLGGMIFHEPTNPLVADDDIRVSDTITGLIKHAGVDSATGRRAMIKLFFFYDRCWLRVYLRWKWRYWLCARETHIRWAVMRWKMRWRANRDDDRFDPRSFLE